MRAWCLRSWLQYGWPLFRLVCTLLPLLTYGPLLALWASHEQHNLFFLIDVLTLYTKIGALWCIYALFGNFHEPWTIDSPSSLLFIILPIRIEPLKAWHGVINLEFIIYLMMFQFHFYLSLLYCMSILVCIFCIICDLDALGIA